eukprot:403371965
MNDNYKMKNNNQRSPKGQRHMINESVKQKDWQELKGQQNLKDKKINYQSYSDDEDSSSLKSGGGKQSGDELEVGDDSQDYQSDMRPSMNQRDVSRLTNQRNFEARSQASNIMSNQLKNQQNVNNNQQLKPSPMPSPNNNQNPTSTNNNKAVSIVEQKEKLLKNIQKQTPQDKVKLLRKRNSHLQSIGYNGYLNIITKKDKSSMTVSEEIFDVLKSIEEFEPFYRDYVVVTVLYLAQPLNKKMLSEELQEAQLGGNQQQQDITNSVRKKFFEWTDGIATAKIFANDSREQDTIIIELLSTKLTKSQARHILSPLLLISSKFVIHIDDAELEKAIQITMPMLLQVRDKYDFTQLKAYDTQDINDVVAEYMPKLMFYASSSNKKLINIMKDGLKPQDILDRCILGIDDSLLDGQLVNSASKKGNNAQNTGLKSQFLVAFKNRELFIDAAQSNNTQVSDIKSKLHLENFPREFFGRKVKMTPDIALRIIKRGIENKDAININEELQECFMEKIEQIYDSASKDFKKLVTSIKGFPRDTEELTTYLIELKNQAVYKIALCKYFALSASIGSKIEDKRKNFENSMFQSALRQCLEHNEKQAVKQSQKMLQTLNEPIQKTLSRDGYSLSNISQMEKDLQILITTYCDSSQSSIGPSQTASLLDFLDEKLITLYNSMIKKEVDSRMKKQEKENRELGDLEQNTQDLEKLLEQRKLLIQGNRDKIEQLTAQKLSQKREVDNLEERRYEQEQELKMKEVEIRVLEEKSMQMQEEKSRIEEDGRRKQLLRIQKMKEQEEIEKKIRDIKSKKSQMDDDDDLNDENKNKNCSCKCHIF